MANTRPVLGYPSTTAAILAMRVEQRSTQEIAEAVGLQPSLVLQREYQARNAVKRTSHRQITLTRTLTLQLEAEAQRLAMSPARLAHLLLSILVEEGLAPAILDGAR